MIHPDADPADVMLKWLGLEEKLRLDNESKATPQLATSIGTLKKAIPQPLQHHQIQFWLASSE